jgi:hypothetical protein
MNIDSFDHVRSSEKGLYSPWSLIAVKALSLIGWWRTRMTNGIGGLGGRKNCVGSHSGSISNVEYVLNNVRGK